LYFAMVGCAWRLRDVAVVRPAHADPRAVVELFTIAGMLVLPARRQGSRRTAKDPSVIALSLPIDYWDYLGWKDTLGRIRASRRARRPIRARVAIARSIRRRRSSTAPAHVIGSDLASIESAIGSTAKADDGVMSVPVTMTQAGKLLPCRSQPSRRAPR